VGDPDLPLFFSFAASFTYVGHTPACLRQQQHAGTMPPRTNARWRTVWDRSRPCTAAGASRLRDGKVGGGNDHQGSYTDPATHTHVQAATQSTGGGGMKIEKREG